MRDRFILGLIFSIVIFIGASTNVSAQVEDPILKACEETVDKLKVAEIKNSSLESENRLLKEMLALKDEKIAIVGEQRDFYKKAYEDSKKIDTNSSMVIDNLRTQVADYRLELNSLRSENDKLRSSRTFRTLVGFGAGFATGYFTNK